MADTDTPPTRRLSRQALVVGATAATLGVLYGYDQSNVGGAQLFFQEDLDLSSSQVELVTAGIVYGELVGALVGGWVANRIGRRLSVIVVTAGYVAFCLLSAVAQTATQLFGARVLLGITVGISIVVVPVFVAESVPARVRGAMLVLYQVVTVIGVLCGYAVSLALSDTGNWRLMLGIAAVPAVVLLPFVLRLPDTPRWYAMKGRWEEAAATLARVDPDADQQAELALMRSALSEETGGVWSQMIHKPYLRATVFVVVLGFFIQITGINATVTYGPRIFEAMGVDSTQETLLMSGLVQVIALVAVLTSLSLIDRVGRRPILLTGIGIMVFAQLLLVVTFLIVGDGTFTAATIALGFAGLALINVGFVFGFGSLVWVYAGEAFPSRLRAYGASAMLTADLVANLLIAQFFLTVMGALGGAGSFGLFAVLAILAWLFVYRYAPETKGRDVDAIQHFWQNGGRWPDEDAAAPHPRTARCRDDRGPGGPDGGRDRRAADGPGPPPGQWAGPDPCCGTTGSSRRAPTGPAGCARQQRPRRALPEVPRRDHPGTPRGPGVTVDADRVRRPPAADGRAVGGGQPVRRLPRPGRVDHGGPRVRSADPRRHQRTGLPPGGCLRAGDRRPRRDRTRGRRDQELHGRACWRCSCWPTPGPGGTGVPPRRSRGWPRRCWPRPAASGWPAATGSSSGWSPPVGATRTPPRGRRP